MLNVLREKKNVKLIMFFIAIIIIPAFVLWGVGSVLRSKGKDSLAGVVFSAKISKQDFIDQYHAVYSQAQVLYGENLAKIKNLLNLEGQTWQRITLLEEAKRRKIKIPDREVVDAIQNSSLFYKNNRFDQDTYQTILTYYLGLTPRKYEEQIRDNLKIKNLIDQETKDIQISEQEAWLTFQNQNTSYNLGYILIKPSDFTEDIEFGPEELEDFYRNKKELFKKPEQVNIEYLAVIFKDLVGNIVLTEDEIADYFYAHKEGFLTGAAEAGEEMTEEIKEKISQALSASKTRKEAERITWQIEDDIISGLSIKEVAEKNSLILKETGFFSPWDPIPGIGWSYAITQDAFSLKPGETGNAIETKDGFYLIQVKDKKDPYLPEVEEIKQQVEAALGEEKSRQLAKNRADHILSEILALEKSGSDMQEHLAANSLLLQETGLINKDSYVKGLGNASDIFLQIKTATPDAFYPEPIESQAGYLVTKIVQAAIIDEAEFEKDKNTIIEQLLLDKKNQHLQDWINRLIERAGIEVYFSVEQ